MLRSNLNIIMDYVRSSSGRTTLAQMDRGKFHMDAAEFSAVTDANLVGTAYGIPVHRLASLADGKFTYVNEAGSTLLSN